MKNSLDRMMLFSGIAWGVSFIAARMMLELPALGATERAVLAFGPSIPFAILLWSAIRVARGLDEMQRRIELEALAFAFGIMVLMIETLALAQKAELARAADWSYVHLLPMLFLAYLGGRLLAMRRYQCETE